jgi:DNA-3-methyladenine glycosylase II
MTLCLTLPAGYELNNTLSMLQQGPEDPINRIDASGTYLRRLHQPHVIVSMTQKAQTLQAHVVHGLIDDHAMLQCTLERLLGTDDPLLTNTRCFKQYPALRPVQNHALPGYETLFEGLADIILGQHVATSVANLARQRLILAYNRPITLHGIDCHAFPAPTCITQHPDKLATLGISQAKQKAIFALAQAAQDPLWCQAICAPSATDSDINQKLTQIYGIGPWTAQWYALRGLRRFHALPEGDLAIRKAIAWLMSGHDQADKQHMDDFKAGKTPWCINTNRPQTQNPPHPEDKALMGLIAYRAMHAYFKYKKTRATPSP